MPTAQTARGSQRIDRVLDVYLNEIANHEHRRFADQMRIVLWAGLIRLGEKNPPTGYENALNLRASDGLTVDPDILAKQEFPRVGGRDNRAIGIDLSLSEAVARQMPASGGTWKVTFTDVANVGLVALGYKPVPVNDDDE